MTSIIKNKNIQAIVVFILAFAIVDFVFLNIITMEHYIWCFIFLLAVSLIAIVVFRKIFIAISHETHKKTLLILLIIPLILHGIACYLCAHFGSVPNGGIGNDGVSFLLLNNFFLRVKPIDILFQQTILIILVKKLYQNGLQLKHIIWIFLLAFGVMHIFQIFRMDLVIALGFTFFALAGSIIFPYMILKVKNGYLYNIIIHLVAYDIAALLFRLIH